MANIIRRTVLTPTSLIKKLCEPIKCTSGDASYCTGSFYESAKNWEINNFSANYADVLCFNQNKPSPTIRAPNELIVQVNSASVNPLDVLMCSGYGNEVLEKIGLASEFKSPLVSYDRFPLTLGRDFSGVVVDKGSAVKNVNLNDQVFGAIPPYKQGTHGQYVVVTDGEVSS